MLGFLICSFAASYTQSNSLKTLKNTQNLRALVAKIFEESNNENIQKFVEKNKDADETKSIKDILIGATDETSKLMAAAFNDIKIKINDMNDIDLNMRISLAKMYIATRPNAEEIVARFEDFFEEADTMVEA